MMKHFAATSIAVLAVLFATSTSAFESHLKMRLHRDVVSSGLTRNFGILLSKVEKDQEKDVNLDDIKATMTDVSIKIRPINKLKWSTV
jgi:hypothetical protein